MGPGQSNPSCQGLLSLCALARSSPAPRVCPPILARVSRKPRSPEQRNVTPCPVPPRSSWGHSSLEHVEGGMPKSAKSRAGGGGSGRRGCPFFGWNRLQEAKDEIVARISPAAIQAAEHSLVLLHHHHHRSFWELLGVTLMQDGCTENLGRGRKLSPGQAQAQQSHSLAFHLLNNTLCGIPRNLGMAKNLSSSKTGIHLLHVFLAVMGHRELRGDSYQGAAEPGSSCCATKASTVLKLSWLDWVGNGKKNYCSGNTQRAQIQGTQKKKPHPKGQKSTKRSPRFHLWSPLHPQREAQLSTSETWQPWDGETKVSPSQAQMSPCSPLCISQTKPRDCCRRAARAGKPRLGGRCSLRGWDPAAPGAAGGSPSQG